jgi:hypothetical protein
VGVYTFEPDGGQLFGAQATRRFNAVVGSTERRILTSNIPIAQVLPSTYAPIVGSPVTYTRYLIGGASACCASLWTAFEPTSGAPIRWEQAGGSTFTLTTSVPGNVTVQWQRSWADGRLFYAMFDPPVRRRDTSAPVATAPVQRFAAAGVGATVPIGVSWTGTDRGWGIASYQVQRSLNGGTWRAIALSSPRAKSVSIQGTPGSTLRFRVRARDKAGHIGAWAYGPTFRVSIRSDANAAVRYARTWSVTSDLAAVGGAVHETTRSGAAATFVFSGRDVAWVAIRGPGHGKAKVYVDGSYVATVDLLADVAQLPWVVYQRHWTKIGTHTLKIVNLGTLGRALVDLDAVAVLR